METVVLDTDILSEILKGKDRIVRQYAEAYSEVHVRFTFTAVSVSEIVFGLTAKGAQRQLQQAEASFAESDVVVPTIEDYRMAGWVRGQARQQGHQLALDDCLIGAVAARLGRPVVTGNTGHFNAMQNAGLELRILNWRKPDPASP